MLGKIKKWNIKIKNEGNVNNNVSLNLRKKASNQIHEEKYLTCFVFQFQTHKFYELAYVLL